MAELIEKAVNSMIASALAGYQLHNFMQLLTRSWTKINAISFMSRARPRQKMLKVLNEIVESN